MSVSVKKNDVVSFKYNGGSNPGQLRHVVVDEVRNYSFSGRDLEKDGGDNFRNYNNSSVVGLTVLGRSENFQLFTLEDVKRSFSLPAMPDVTVAAGLVKLYNPKHIVVPTNNGVLLALPVPVKTNKLTLSTYPGKATVKLTNKADKTMLFSLTNDKVTLEGIDIELKTLFTTVANFLSA